MLIESFFKFISERMQRRIKKNDIAYSKIKKKLFSAFQVVKLSMFKFTEMIDKVLFFLNVIAVYSL